MKLDLSRPVGYIYACPACKKTFTLFASKMVIKEVGLIYCPKCNAVFDTTGIPPQTKEVVPKILGATRITELTKLDIYLGVPIGTFILAFDKHDKEAINLLGIATTKYGVTNHIFASKNRVQWIQIQRAAGMNKIETGFDDFNKNLVVLENLGETLCVDSFKPEGREMPS